MKVTVIDYGLSNLLSVQHAFAHFGAEVQVTSSPADVLAADALVLPGVGAFQDGMQGLEQLGLIEPIKQKTAQSRPRGAHPGCGRGRQPPAGAAHQLEPTVPGGRPHGFFRYRLAECAAGTGMLFYPLL